MRSEITGRILQFRRDQLYYIHWLIGLLFLWTDKAISNSEGVLYNDHITVPTGIHLAESDTITGWVFADVNGDGHHDLCIRVSHWGRSELRFYDLRTRQLLTEAPVRGNDNYFFPADLEGDGIEEIVYSRIEYSSAWGSGPGVEIFRWQQGKMIRTEYTDFRGMCSRIGDFEGDGSDEIILCDLYQGYNLGGNGPIRIRLLSWNGTTLESIAQLTLPTAYFRIYVGDLDDNGRDELAVLRSGYWEGSPFPGTPILGVYAFTGPDTLTLLDEMTFRIPYTDNVPGIWGIPLLDNKQRIAVRVPSQYGYEPTSISFRFKDQKLTREYNVLNLDKEFYGSNYHITFYRPDFNRIDIDGDNWPETLRIFKMETSNEFHYIKTPRPQIEITSFPSEQQLQHWTERLLRASNEIDPRSEYCDILDQLTSFNLPEIPWPSEMQDFLFTLLKRTAASYTIGDEIVKGECLAFMLRMASHQLNPKFKPILIQHLDLSEWATKGLTGLGPEVFPEVMQIIEQDTSSRHYHAVETIKLMFMRYSSLYDNQETRERAAQGLMGLIRTGDSIIRRIAIETFGYIEHDGAAALLDSIIQVDTSEEIRNEARSTKEIMRRWRSGD